MTRTIALILLAMPAHAQDTRSLSGSTVTMQQTDRPGAAAEVIFHNRSVNWQGDNATFPLQLGALGVVAEFAWNVLGDEDRITVTPPPGYVCLPQTCVLQLGEETSDTLYLYSIEGVGM